MFVNIDFIYFVLSKQEKTWKKGFIFKLLYLMWHSSAISANQNHCAIFNLWILHKERHRVALSSQAFCLVLALDWSLVLVTTKHCSQTNLLFKKSAVDWGSQQTSRISKQSCGIYWWTMTYSVLPGRKKLTYQIKLHILVLQSLWVETLT